MSANHWQVKLSPLLQNIGVNQERHRFPLLVEVKARQAEKICALVDGCQGKTLREIGLISALAIELPAHSLNELVRNRLVRKVWSDVTAYALLDVAVPTVGSSKVQEWGYTGKGIVVAVIDTGIYPHNDLVVPDNRILAWNDLINNQKKPYDDNGHGTHVSGIIAGNGRSSDGKYKGMAPEARLVGVKALDDKGSGSLSTVIAGIDWCLNNLDNLNIKVINLSLGVTAQESYRTDPLCRAVDAAWRKGIVVCAAAGNAGPGLRSINSPGISPSVITVGNIDDQNTLNPEDDRIHSSSSGGPTIDNLPKPDLIAPGTEITSLSHRGGYQALTGTSMSTPMVAGAAAQILQKYPSITPDKLKQLLMKNARSRGLGRNLQGAGELDLSKIFKGPATKVLMENKGFPEAVTFQMLKTMLAKSNPGMTDLQGWLDKRTEKSIITILDTLLK